MGTDMTKGRPLPVLLRFTIPLLLGNLFQQFYNMADTIIVGRYVGAGALAAVGSTGIIMFLITGFAQGLTSGFTILTAQRYGAGDTAGVKRERFRRDLSFSRHNGDPHRLFPGGHGSRSFVSCRLRRSIFREAGRYIQDHCRRNGGLCIL